MKISKSIIAWLLLCGLAVSTEGLFAQSRGALDNPKHNLESLGKRPLSTYERWALWPHNSMFYQAGTPVGYLEVQLTDGSEIECTGMVIAASLVLSARHCIRDEDDKPVDIQTIRFWLGNTHDDGGTPYTLENAPVDVGTTKADDFLVLKSTTPFKLTELRIPKLGQDPTVGQPLYVYHHPYGQPLTLTRMDCWATKEIPPHPKDQFLRHTCDTQAGSSGAPILNEDFELVGIHIADGKSEKKGSFNEGLLISYIIQVSSIAKSALARATGAVAHVPESAVTPARTASYRTSKGDVFALSGGTWSLIPQGSAANSRIALKAQTESDGAYVLWEPNADVFYKIPIRGGAAQVRRAQDGYWTEFETVTKQ